MYTTWNLCAGDSYTFNAGSKIGGSEQALMKWYNKMCWAEAAKWLG